MAHTTRTPAFPRRTSTRAPDRTETIETTSGTPIPGPGDDDDDERPGWLASVAPAPLRPAAERVEDLGLWLLGRNAGVLTVSTHAIVGFCAWYTVLHGFFGVSWCFGQAGHYHAPDASPPAYHAPSALGRTAKPDNDGDASGGEEGR